MRQKSCQLWRRARPATFTFLCNFLAILGPFCDPKTFLRFFWIEKKKKKKGWSVLGLEPTTTAWEVLPFATYGLLTPLRIMPPSHLGKKECFSLLYCLVQILVTRRILQFKFWPPQKGGATFESLKILISTLRNQHNIFWVS